MTDSRRALVARTLQDAAATTASVMEDHGPDVTEDGVFSLTAVSPHVPQHVRYRDSPTMMGRTPSRGTSPTPLVGSAVQSASRHGDRSGDDALTHLLDTVPMFGDEAVSASRHQGRTPTPQHDHRDGGGYAQRNGAATSPVPPSGASASPATVGRSQHFHTDPSPYGTRSPPPPGPGVVVATVCQDPACVALRSRVEALESQLKGVKDTVGGLEEQMGKLAYNVRSHSALIHGDFEALAADAASPLHHAPHSSQQHRDPYQNQGSGGHVPRTAAGAALARYMEASSSEGEPDEPSLHPASPDAVSPNGTEGGDDDFSRQLHKAEELARRAKELAKRKRHAKEAARANNAMYEAYRSEIRIFEKRLLSIITQLATRVSGLEGDVTDVVTQVGTVESTLRDQIDQVASSKVDKQRFQQKVTECVTATRQPVQEQVSHLYAVLDLSVEDVQDVARMSPQQRGEASAQLLFSGTVGNILAAEIVRTESAIAELNKRLTNALIHRSREVKLDVFSRMLGMDMSEVTDGRGVRVAQVFAGGPASVAGVQAGDSISRCNHVRVTSRTEFMRVMAHVLPHSMVKLEVTKRGTNASEIVEVLATPNEYLTDQSPLA